MTSTITPSGLTGTLSNITVTLNPGVIVQFQETFYILEAPSGAAIVLFGQACVSDTGSDDSFTLSDAAASAALQASSVTINCNTLTGSYKPGSDGVGTALQSIVSSYNLPPSDGNATLLSTFGGQSNLNNAWTLYAIEESQDGISGSLGNSLTPAWSMTITTAAAAATLRRSPRTTIPPSQATP